MMGEERLRDPLFVLFVPEPPSFSRCSPEWPGAFTAVPNGILGLRRLGLRSNVQKSESITK